MVAGNDIQTGTASGARTEHYRCAERAFWDHHGLAPTERFVKVGSPPVRLRVQELGSGEPVRQRKSARALSEMAITAGFRIFLSTVIA